MGNFEKLVVLVILLASAGALAVSLNNSETTQGTPSDLESTPGAALPTTAGMGTKAPSTQPASKQPRGGAANQKNTLVKLDAGYNPPQKKAPKAMPSKNGMPYILLNKKGLRKSFMTEDYMTFAPASGDTWMSLAQRFYGNRSHASAIKMANEGVSQPDDVDLLMIPLYDFAVQAAKRSAFKPAPVVVKRPFRSADMGVTEAAAKAPVAASNPAGGITYTVKPGDSLSLISKKVYGKASRWREIFAANRDKMKSENALKLGMQLYIPKAGEFKPASIKDDTKVH